jgi:hypothetical protein
MTVLQNVVQSSTLVSLYETAPRNIPENGRLHAYRRQNLKSHIICSDLLNEHDLKNVK